ncbi:hypothetical protein L6452_11656 [Arctium lappa]|uniref:Uncharacterized protein n=1 Tax=Arctium lappa TaxID=4217 RepID=A0ACB9DQF6_ARCLA|nr:hypothetical protein L6452_11656 [Arctium lappa]
MMIDIIFCSSVLFPIFRIKRQLLNLLHDSFSYVFRYNSLYLHLHLHQSDLCLMDLPIIRFEDLQDRRQREVEEMCFACSTNYDNDDIVCQLSRCGHVFHSECVGKLIHQKVSDCPFCRSSFFSRRLSLPRLNF